MIWLWFWIPYLSIATAVCIFVAREGYKDLESGEAHEDLRYVLPFLSISYGLAWPVFVALGLYLWLAERKRMR
ncbi:membrane protein [Microbacterium phage Pumpernickel]|uniref:Membrane protein n=1 Tax=Microbacterium phage Pumpernickel TaxID=2885983 RepID=A0AAE8YBE1_9CAUD|nr:membrane protein [Microbacterium phage Pumpernickel]UDL15854.1 membrane protein [Microbacterium phage Pumpernickel]